MSRPLVARPWFWLTFQAALLTLLFLCWDYYRLWPTDTDYYVNVALNTDWLSLDQVLSSYRTFGYPLFVRAVLAISPTLTALPLCHVLVRMLAVFAFYGGLRQVGIGGWLALATASVFLYSNTIFAGYTDLLSCYVLSDALGESFTILTAALLLAAIGRPGSVLAWGGFTLSLFLTYQVRPMLQFLVVLLPPVGILLLRLFAERLDWMRRRRRFGLGLAVACMLPLLAWCGLRLAVVGHFGLVSFSGHALIGIAGQFLTADLVPELPEDLRPFARVVLEKRAQLVSGEAQPLYGAPWRPALDDDGQLRPGAAEDMWTLVITQVQLYEFTAAELFGPDNIVQDRKLLEMALAIIRARPRPYLQWLAQSAPITLAAAATGNYVFNWLIVLVLTLLVVWLTLAVARLLRGELARETSRRAPADCSAALAALWVLAVSVALCNAAVIFLMQQPLPRYVATGGVFLPAAAVVAIVAVSARIWDLWSGGSTARTIPEGTTSHGPHFARRIFQR